VDDDLVSSRALVTTLARGDVKATAFSDPFQALQQLRSSTYDVVLLDINLPGMSGISLCEQMRQLPLHQHTPVIFMTSYSEFGAKAHSLLARGDDLISKPVMPIDLTVRVIAHVVERGFAQ
jgi:CheY-like chemotaxis protein